MWDALTATWLLMTDPFSQNVAIVSAAVIAAIAIPGDLIAVTFWQ